ncbi:hypothetical protein [Streptomyces sp. NPDC001507]|uniref:hypothetical protein n=1 Tax=Streptomyces sp. NPDC001507 TaxID=3364579 RepID=UPI003695600B
MAPSEIESRFNHLARQRREHRARLREIDEELRAIMPDVREIAGWTLEAIQPVAELSMPTIRKWSRRI